MALPDNDENGDDDGFGLADFLEGEIVQIAGAAADAAESEPSLSRFPRLARFALIEALDPHEAHTRLCADLGEIDADLGARAGAINPAFDPDGALALAAELDRAAALRDRPDLRSFADGLRLQALPANVKARERRWAVRIAQALTDCVGRVRALTGKTDVERHRIAELEVLAAGCQRSEARWGSRACDRAASLGAWLTPAARPRRRRRTPLTTTVGEKPMTTSYQIRIEATDNCVRPIEAFGLRPILHVAAGEAVQRLGRLDQAGCYVLDLGGVYYGGTAGCLGRRLREHLAGAGADLRRVGWRAPRPWSS